MTGYSYRIPKYPVAPGTKPDKKDMEVATAWKIKSMITQPEAEHMLKGPGKLQISGHAWAGEDDVSKVEISTDYGNSWQKAKLAPAKNKYAWQTFTAETNFKDRGYYEVWARATDDKGNAQPFRQEWNPKGYLGNVIHRIPVFVGISANG